MSSSYQPHPRGADIRLTDGLLVVLLTECVDRTHLYAACTVNDNLVAGIRKSHSTV